MPTFSIRAMQAVDADIVLAIYQQGIETGIATFQDCAPDWADWNKGHLSDCRLVAVEEHNVEENNIVGWAALSPVSSRCVYSGVAEVSIYVSDRVRGRGIGRRLLSALIDASEQIGIWTLQAGVFPANQASIVLHQKLGFCIVGTRERLGCMTYGPYKGQWLDVVFLERRSNRVG